MKMAGWQNLSFEDSAKGRIGLEGVIITQQRNGNEFYSFVKDSKGQLYVHCVFPAPPVLGVGLMQKLVLFASMEDIKKLALSAYNWWISHETAKALLAMNQPREGAV
jgi:hypothetical protein